jgi:hypothetical protein
VGAGATIGQYGIRLTHGVAPSFSYVGHNRHQTAVFPLLPYIVNFGPSLQRLYFGDIANGANLSHQQMPVIMVAPSANRTGILLTAGTYHEQLVTVVNDSNFTVTFAATGTYGVAGASNVAGGTNEVIGAQQARTFVWVDAAKKWYAQR